MAIIKCRECRKKISSTAKSCPLCGCPDPRATPLENPKRKTKLSTWLVLIFFGIPLLFAVYSSATKPPPPPKTAEELRTERIERGFSGWNGAHIKLQRKIKENLKDPESYEHIETFYGDKGDFLLVRTKYRARNSFGGMTIGEIGAKTSLDGEVIEIVYSE